MVNEKRLIDANALVADLELLAKHEDDFRQSVILGVVHTVRNRPTVDAVEVVHARWVLCQDDGYEWYECSSCRAQPLNDNAERPSLSDYCPNCGAKMDEERKD